MALTKATGASATLGYFRPEKSPMSRSVEAKLCDALNVLDYGAVGDGVTDDSYAIQSAIRDAVRLGTYRIFIPAPKVEFLCKYPIFLMSKVEVFGTGFASKVVFENPTFSMGRGAFVIGSSYEINREKVFAAYDSGAWVGKPVKDESYVNPGQRVFIRDNAQYVECEDASIHDLYIEAKYTGSTKEGGYGVNFVNAKDCTAYNLAGKGWTQFIGMGSDVTPETPSNYRCSAFNLHVFEPNQVKTYYSIAFIANSTDCIVQDAWQYMACAEGTPNGSGVATNITEDCTIRNIHIKDLGRTESSEGVLINNSRGTLVENIHVGNAKTAVAHFYKEYGDMNDAARPNIFRNITGVGCDSTFATRAKHAIIDGLTSRNCLREVYFGNINATHNVFLTKPVSMDKAGSWTMDQFLQNNQVKGWQRKQIYFRPQPYLVQDKSSLRSYDTNRKLETNAGAGIDLMIPLDYSIKAVSQITVMYGFGAGSQSASTNLHVALRKIKAFDGNTGDAAVEVFAGDKAPASDSSASGSFSVSSTDPLGYTLASDSEGGLAHSLDVLVSMQNPTKGCVLKEIRMSCIVED